MKYSSDDYKLEVIRGQLRFENPEWSNERVFQAAIAQVGYHGSFGRPTESQGDTVLIGEATSGLDGVSRLKKASGGVQEQIFDKLSEKPSPPRHTHPKVLLIEGAKAGLYVPLPGI